jgi:hypothetical protein
MKTEMKNIKLAIYKALAGENLKFSYSNPLGLFYLEVL